MTEKENSDNEPRVTEPDAMLLEQLSGYGVDINEKRIIDYCFVAASVEDAEALCLCLQGMGHEFVDMPSEAAFEDEDRAGLWIESCELIAPVDAARKTESLRLIASEFNCKYDGWSTTVEAQPAAE